MVYWCSMYHTTWGTRSVCWQFGPYGDMGRMW